MKCINRVLSGFLLTALLSAAGLLYAPGALFANSDTVKRLRAYDYKTLYSKLGYTDNYFGSDEDAIYAIKTYAEIEDPFYEEINGYLRFYPQEYDWYGTPPEEAAKIVRLIDSIFPKVPAIPNDLLMFRGLRLGFRGNKPYSPGEEFTDKAYSSTSASFKIAEKFALNSNDEAPSLGALMVIYSENPNLKGILINQGEDEIMLPRNQKFKVMAFKGQEKYDLYLVQLCAQTCKSETNQAAKKLWAQFLKQQKP